MRALAWLWLLALTAAGLLAPLLANDVPIVARTAQGYRFPALASYAGSPGLAPDGQTWKAWWASRADDGDEWALMPVWPRGVREVDPDRICAPPGLADPLGRDDTGRDLLARMLHGAATSILIGLGTALLAAALGVPLGACAGWRAFGFVDGCVLRAVEVCMCFPSLFLALATVALFGPSTLAVVLVLAAVTWTTFARIVRGEMLSLREREFVWTARGLGLSTTRILARHVLPQLRGPVLVTGAFVVAVAIVVEAGMSFLGLGPGLVRPSWGTILAQGRENAHLGAWHLWLVPTVAIALTVISLHTLATDAEAHARRG